MKARLIRWLLLTAFAVSFGHFTWQTLVGPPLQSTYAVGGEVTSLCGPNPDEKHLNLRKNLFLSQLPRKAWLQVVSRDHLELYVNGKMLENIKFTGFPCAIQVDLTPYLHQGKNVIAIAARQASFGYPPAVAVDGAYLLSDGEHPLQADGPWRCNSVFERKGIWWFEEEFKDGDWPLAQLKSCYLRAKVDDPPRSFTVAETGHWLTPRAVEDGMAAFRRAFEVSGKTEQAWLRVTTTVSYRLAVNGHLIDQQGDAVNNIQSAAPVQRTYDLTALIHRGNNLVSLLLKSPAGFPQLKADLEVVNASGQKVLVGTDDQWLCRAGFPTDWLQPRLDPGSGWQEPIVDSTDLGHSPWEIRRAVVAISLPLAVKAWRVAGQALLTLLLALGTILACRCARRWLSSCQPDISEPFPLGPIYLALVPPTVVMTAMFLATYDPNKALTDIYRFVWWFLLVLSLPGQWGLLAYFLRRRQMPTWEFDGKAELTRALPILTLIGLVVIGFWIRYRGIDREPMQWDEARVYRASMGFLERGFPSVILREDVPIMYSSTCELLYGSTGLGALVFNDPRYVIRFPAVCFGTLTIILIYLMGRRLFNQPVGLIAAALYTFATVCLGMSCFGRYFEQLQFMTLLTLYCFWMCIRGFGPIDQRWLWWTAVCFIATFLSWEGSALVAPSMVIAALVLRRGRMGTILTRPAVYMAMMLVLTAILLQGSHRLFHQVPLQVYGNGASGVALKPMWKYGFFDLWFYVWNSSWNQDSFLPMMALLGAALLAVRHPFRRPLRFLLLVLLSTSFLTAALLPIVVWRYIHHMTPVLILLGAAAIYALARSLYSMVQQVGVPRVGRVFGQVVAAGLVLAFISLSSGMTLRLSEMENWRTSGPGPGAFMFQNLEGPSKFVRDHYQEGDIVLGIHPHAADHWLGPVGLATDYWSESTLHLQALLPDKSFVPVDRRSGAEMIPSWEAMQDLFTRNKRIWYVIVPSSAANSNDRSVSAFLRQHMDVVFEDHMSMVLFRDANHRSAALRQENEKALKASSANLIP